MMIIRRATIEDAPFIAWTVLTAVGVEDSDNLLMDSVSELCRREDVLYSWRNSMLAVKEGQVVACLIAYDGADYQSMRVETFRIIAEETGRDFRNMDDETGAGEFYIDSLAVLPEYRGQGIATGLLKASIDYARHLAIGKVAMVVSPDNSEAQHLYESLGFRYAQDMFLFNENYRKMIKEL